MLNSRKLANSDEDVGGDIVAPATPKKKPVKDAEKRDKAGMFLYVERQDGGGAGKCRLKQSTKFNWDPTNRW